MRAAFPPNVVERLATVGPDSTAVSVSGRCMRMRSGYAQLLGRDQGEDGAGALAVIGQAGGQIDGVVLLDADRARGVIRAFRTHRRAVISAAIPRCRGVWSHCPRQPDAAGQTLRLRSQSLMRRAVLRHSGRPTDSVRRLAVRGLVAHMQTVLHPKVHRIHTDRVRHLVDGLLDRRADLGVAEAAEGAE